MWKSVLCRARIHRTGPSSAEAAAEKLRMVVSVSEDLSSTLDVEDAVARLALHLVPALADWCLVTLVDEHGHLRDLGCHHVDPAKLALVRAYRDARLGPIGGGTDEVMKEILGKQFGL